MKRIFAILTIFIVLCFSMQSCSFVKSVCAHLYLGETVKEVSCSEKGLRHMKCKFCGDEYDEVVEKVYHTADSFGNCVYCGKSIARDLSFSLNTEGTEYSVRFTANYLNLPIIIPENHYAVPVVAIENDGFSNVAFTEISIPPKVKRIGENAFYKSVNFTEISLPASVKIVGSKAFANCLTLAKFEFYPFINSFSPDAFDGCISLTTVVFHGTESEFRNYASVFPSTVSVLYV
ncbi:MAG: leucine-rich repeat domain-containing protein [Clostridia bacterium]|nr:leucine-rich repeat domain-containing protein [Clostridia bacterium]